MCLCVPCDFHVYLNIRMDKESEQTAPEPSAGFSVWTFNLLGSQAPSHHLEVQLASPAEEVWSTQSDTHTSRAKKTWLVAFINKNHRML